MRFPHRPNARQFEARIMSPIRTGSELTATDEMLAATLLD
jgi:hypothetical protein